MSYQYEFTRSIKFFLKGDDIEKPAFVTGKSEAQKICKDFQKNYILLLENFKNSVFVETKDGGFTISSKLEIKYPWLRQYAKEDYYRLHPNAYSPKKYTVKEAKFLRECFNSWIERNKTLLEEMQAVFSRSEENQAKISDISFLIKQFFGTDYFSFVRDFVLYANDKSSDKNLDILKKNIETIKVLAEKIIFISSPNQSGGIEVKRASFNYFTINKISKNFNQDIENKKQDLQQPYKIQDNQFQLLKSVGFPDADQIAIENLSLKNFYKDLKDFKSRQKKSFIEEIEECNSTKNLSKTKSRFPLFFSSNPEELRKFYNATMEIASLSEQKNKAEQRNDRKNVDKLGEDIKDVRIKRGNYFQYSAEKYKNYCELFKKVAMTYGRIKAEIRALEQEKIEARLLKYWAHIFEKDGKHSILLISKESDNLANAKRYLQAVKNQENGKFILYSFNSLTLKALNKLIRKNCPREIPELNKNPIPIYKKALRREYRNIVLDFEGFEAQIQELMKKEYESEEDFRIALESIAYSLQKKYLTEKDIETLKNDYGSVSLEITSYDLSKSPPKEKEHTTLWKNFWKTENKQNNYPIRLNPEIRIFYRQKKENQPPKKQKNRFSKDCGMVAFTVTQNAAQKRMETAFVEEKDLSEMIRKFNQEIVQKFIEEKGENLYYYGIDRGNQELATLCATRFYRENYTAKLLSGEVKSFRKPIFPDIKTYRIKNECLRKTKLITIDRKGKQKEIKAISNPSYFLTDEKEIEEVFEEVKNPFIDLTTAKLIKGKIILNGDVMTYLFLKKANAKRRLFEVFTENDFEDWKVKFNEEENAFVVNLKNKKRKPYQILCYYSSREERVFSQEDMRKELQDYLDNLHLDKAAEIITIESINNLRDAIASNMVGIIRFLFEKYPGIIKLENLHENEIGKHFRNNNENIERRLEWSLYKKFQKMSLVPPRLKQTIFLRKKDDMQQFGIIHFIPKGGTSGNCPFCGEKTSMKNRKEKKFKEHRYVCNNCGFDTNNPKFPLENIRSSDDAAAYNIAVGCQMKGYYPVILNRR